jgi:integrase
VWELRVHVGGGKYRSRTYRGSAKNADAALRTLIGEVEAERARPASGLTVSEWMWRWLARGETTWASPATVRTARNVIASSIDPTFGAVALDALTRVDIDGWVAGLQQRGLAAATIKRYHGTLRAALEEAVRLELLAANPASRTRLPKVARREHPQIPADRLADAYAAADQQTKLLIRLATATGVRKGQLVGFRWSDFDHERGTVTVARSVARADSGVVVKETKTGSIHTMTIDADTLALVGEWRSHLEDERGRALGDDSYVFSNDANRTVPWYPDTVNVRWRAVAQPAGLGHIRVHDLRHFHATTLISQGVDVVTVASRLGHKNPAVTLRVYSHPITEADQAAAATLSRFLPTD